MDRRAQRTCFLRLCQQLPDRHRPWGDCRCRSYARHPTGGSWSGANNAGTDGDPLWHKARVWPPTAPTARRRAWLRWSNARRSRHTFQSSTNQIEPMARSLAPISSSTPNATATPAPRAKSLFNSDAHTPFPEAASQPRAQTLSRQQIGLRCLRAQSPVLSERSCPQDPAGSGRRFSRRGPRARRNSAIRRGLSPAGSERRKRAAQDPPKNLPTFPAILRASSSEEILDGFFNGIGPSSHFEWRFLTLSAFSGLSLG